MGEEIIGPESSEECLPASQPASQPFFGYWFWLLVPDEIMGRFVLRGLYLYPVYPLVVSSTPKRQAAGSLCLVCAGSKAAPTVTNGCGWNNESLFSKSELLGRRLGLLRGWRQTQQALHGHQFAALFRSDSHHQKSHRFRESAGSKMGWVLIIFGIRHTFPLL